MRTTPTVVLLMLLALTSCQLEAEDANDERQMKSSITFDDDMKSIQYDVKDRLLIDGVCFRDRVCKRQHGGACVAGDQQCDVIVPNAGCGPSCDCQCCIQCSEGSCGDSTTGNCKIECSKEEYSEGDCSINSCKCCKACVSTNCAGRCVSEEKFCKRKEYIEGECEGGNCVCCVQCKQDGLCKESGGQCINSDKMCPRGLWPSPDLSCDDGACKCCVPCIPSCACAAGPIAGRCVDDPASCDGNDEYTTDDGCINGDCTCCKKCKPNNRCSRQGGICYDGSCPEGYETSRRGKCEPDSRCTCCVEES